MHVVAKRSNLEAGIHHSTEYRSSDHIVLRNIPALNENLGQVPVVWSSSIAPSGAHSGNNMSALFYKGSQVHMAQLFHILALLLSTMSPPRTPILTRLLENWRLQPRLKSTKHVGLDRLHVVVL
jgi:hypothetical protein